VFATDSEKVYRSCEALGFPFSSVVSVCNGGAVQSITSDEFNELSSTAITMMCIGYFYDNYL
jgi:hypothetical protein